MVLISSFLKAPKEVWQLGYILCMIKSLKVQI